MKTVFLKRVTDRDKWNEEKQDLIQKRFEKLMNKDATKKDSQITNLARKWNMKKQNILWILVCHEDVY